MTVGSFTTGMTLTVGGLSIDQLYAAAGLRLPATPGCVGVCLSGGWLAGLSGRHGSVACAQAANC
jgi:hypothetical protein